MSIYPRQRLGSLIAEVSERNRTMQCTDVYSVTNRQGFVPSEDYFNKKVFSKDISNYKLVRHEMLAYNPSRINVGSIAYLREKKCVAVSPLYVVFRIKEPALLPAWLEYFLRSEMGRTQIRALTSGSVRDSLKYTALERIEIPRVPLEIQESNLANLTALDRSIAICETLLEKLDELVKSQFVELFGDPVTNPMGWERARLADKCEIVTGNTPSRKVKEYYGKDLEWIKSDNITEATTLTEATEYLSDEGAKVGRTVETGSILMTCIAGSLRSIGNVAIVDRKVAFNQQINAIVPKKQNTYFMYEQFRLSKDYICSGINMALKGILSKGQLSEIEFVFPPLALQNEFAAFAQQADKSEFLLRQLLEKQQTLKKALMQEYFS